MTILIIGEKRFIFQTFQKVRTLITINIFVFKGLPPLFEVNIEIHNLAIFIFLSSLNSYKPGIDCVPNQSFLWLLTKQ